MKHVASAWGAGGHGPWGAYASQASKHSERSAHDFLSHQDRLCVVRWSKSGSVHRLLASLTFVTETVVSW